MKWLTLANYCTTMILRGYYALLHCIMWEFTDPSELVHGGSWEDNVAVGGSRCLYHFRFRWFHFRRTVSTVWGLFHGWRWKVDYRRWFRYVSNGSFKIGGWQIWMPLTDLVNVTSPNLSSGVDRVWERSSFRHYVSGSPLSAISIVAYLHLVTLFEFTKFVTTMFRPDILFSLYNILRVRFNKV